MVDQKELYDKVKIGAGGNVAAAVEACNIILKEDYLGMVGWPEKSHQKQTFAPRPNDKGHKMTAKKTGSCIACKAPITIGEEIYFKSGEGAKHSTCTVDVVA